MDTQTAPPQPDDSGLRVGQQIIYDEGQALINLSQRLDKSFASAVDRLLECRGVVLVIGVGKAGLIGQKISATLASTGTSSHFLHPTEAVHGDLGRCRSGDAALILSNSGESNEVVQLIPTLRDMGILIIAITSRPHSGLAKSSEIVLSLGDHKEAGNLSVAPTTSTTLMLALGDALALAVADRRGFQATDFARFHPGGSLGKSLMPVEQVMRRLQQCRCGREDEKVRDVLVRSGRPGRRTGAIMITDSSGRLTGIFTDSDLARLFEQRRDSDLDRSLGEVMTIRPTTVRLGTRLSETVEILSQRKISELPVVDTEGRPQGLLDITDLIDLLPKEAQGCVVSPISEEPASKNPASKNPASKNPASKNPASDNSASDNSASENEDVMTIPISDHPSRRRSR